MIKKILISIPLLLTINQQLEARKLPDLNICEENFLENVEDRSDFYKEIKEKEFKTKLYNKKLQPIANRLKENLSKKLYDTDSLKKYLTIILNDKYNGTSKRKFKPTILRERAFTKNILLNILFSLELNQNKDIILKYYKQALKDERLKKLLFSYNYTNFKILEHLDFFKNEEQKEIFSDKIIHNDKFNEIISLYFTLTDTDNMDIFSSTKEEKKYKRKVEKILEECHFEKKILNKSSKYKLLDIIELFNYSILFPKYKQDLTKYYYAISYKENNWLFLNYFYNHRHEHYIKATKNLELLYGLENNPKYLKYLLINEYLNSATEATNLGEHILAWKYSVKGLKLIYKNKTFSKEDRKKIIKMKKILTKKAERIIDLLMQNNESRNANKINLVTQKLLNKVIY